MTGEEWDARWWVIYNDLMAQEGSGDQVDGFAAALIADREAREQFGLRPEDVAS